MRKLILFDIDGTLIWTDGAGRAAIRRALMTEMGETGPVEGFRFDGKTDPQIIHELLSAAQHPHAGSGPHVAAVCARYVELLSGELAKRKGNIRIFPAVVQLLELLEARSDALLGLLTGNLAEGARLKLEAAGIDPNRFRVGAFGSDSASRPALAAIAVERVRELLSWTPSGDEIVIVGDTPSDMTCGESVGARAIGVATGFFSVAQLLDAGAFRAFENFQDTAAVLDAMYA